MAQSARADVPLSFFERQVGSSPALGAAGAYVEQQTALLQGARDKAGPEFFGANDLGPHRSVVTNTSSRSYLRYGQEVGLRFPILGKHALQQEDIVGATAGEGLARLAYDDTRRQLLGKLRESYIGYLTAYRSMQMSKTFIQELQAEAPAARALRRSGFWTAASLLNYLDLIEKAKLDVAQAGVDQNNARAQLSLATNQPVAPFTPVQPVFTNCSATANGAFHAAIVSDIPLAKLGVQRREANELTGLLRWTGYDASLDVGIGTSVDAPGGVGLSLLVGATVGVPLRAARMKDDRANAIAAQLKQYNLLEQQRRAELTADIETAVTDRIQASAQLVQARNYERALQEDLRESRIRMKYVEPNTLTDVLTKAEVAYKARVAVVMDEEDVLLRINDLLLVAPTACGTQEVTT